MTDALPFSPAAERNREPILATLRQMLPAHGQALEVACGTGQHAAWFAQHLPGWHWWPTDAGADLFPAVLARTLDAGLRNVAAPSVLNLLAPEAWPLGEQRFDLVYAANLLHIAPWACAEALMRLAARHLAPGGCLVTYGPYLEDEVPTAEGNRQFDASLRQQNPAWGVRRREDLQAEAARAGLALAQRHALPANNLLLVWVRAEGAGA